jgi:ADP-heptose:LPS heptosyltransferase
MRVLLVRLDGVGDAAVCTPLLAGLRAAGHDVGVALTTRNAGIFAPDAIVAEHVLERIPWPAHGSTAESNARARAEIAAMRYDVALIASEEPEAYALAAPIPVRRGFTTGWARPLKTLWVRSKLTRAVDRSQRVGGEDEHEAEVLYRLGAGLVREPRAPTERAALREVLIGVDLPAHAPNDAPARAPAGIVLQAGPKWRAVGVPDDVQRAIVERLAPNGLRVVAGPGEAEDVRAATGVAPETFGDLRAWMRALDEATVVVTVDTGAAHVAGMLGRSVVDVFPDEHFEAHVRRWRPWVSAYRAFRASDVRGGAGAALAETVLDGF